MVLAGLTVVGVLTGGGLVLLQNATAEPEGKRAAPSVPVASPGSSTPKPRLTGSADILAGNRRTLIHMVEIDRDLALPFPDELKAGDGTGQDALFALVPTGVDHMIQSVQPTEGEPPCLGVKVHPEDEAELVATECAPTKATLFSISATGRRDEKGRPTYLIYNDAHGFIQWWDDKSEIYVEHTGDGPPDTTFSFVDRGPV